MSVIVITGAGRGLGEETARRLVEAGHTVWAAGRDARSEAAAARVGAAYVRIDVTDTQSVIDAAARIDRMSGRVDVLVNNAGVPEPASDAGLTAESMRNVFEVNVFGAVRMIEAFKPLLARSDAPTILNVSSESGSFASNLDPDDIRFGVVSLAYAPSKAALNMLTLQYAKALPHYRVIAVAPGFTRTGFNNNSGVQTVREGSADARTGTFISRTGEVGW